MSKRPVILIILDGYGIGKSDDSNPIFAVGPNGPQNINHIKANYPSAALQSSGIAVGLPWKEEGNSEAGHLNIGAGKIIYQNYPRVSLAIQDKSFFKNKTILTAFNHSKKNNSAVNLIGLLTEGNVHASLEHLEALIEFAKNEKVPTINLHLITDGRDSSPQSALKLLKRLSFSEQIKLASIAGRYYAMDNNKQWGQTQQYYQTIVGEGSVIENIENHINGIYQKGLDDEYILPAVISSQENAVKDNDSVIFFNFREDRMRQIVESFANPAFDKFPVKKFSNLYVSSLISYDDRFKIPVAFPKETVENPLSKILSDSGKIQFKIAETEKYAHITYFFNGQKEPPFKNEYRVLIPSKTDFRHEEHPEMMATEITGRLIEAIEEGGYDFILANYANADIIAHTGNFEAAVQAVKVLDEQIDKLAKAALSRNAILIITADHGNIERMVDPLTGETETKHDLSPVPIYLIANEFEKPKTEEEIKISEKTSIGVLADIAPTILELMKIPQPKEMTGQSLLKFLV